MDQSYSPALTALFAAACVLQAALASSAAAVPSADPGSEFFRAGEASYMLYCAGCHQPTGAGVAGAFPPLAGSEWVAGDPARSIKIVLNGLTGPLSVGEQQFNAEMPPQGALLSDDQLAAVITFVRNSWGNEAPAVDPAAVAEIRREFGDRLEFWKTTDLLADHPIAAPEATGESPLVAMKFAVYEGNWSRLPDFDRTPASENGNLPGNLLTLDVRGDRGDQFGLRFEGQFEAPAAGDYTFWLSSDDGSRIEVDGQEVVELDGVHPAGGRKRGKIRLRKGLHPIRIDYFEAAGDEVLDVGVNGPQLGEFALSDFAQKRASGGSEKAGMLIGPSGGRARIYRGFIEGIKGRAIAVGFPGAVNIAWDADNMRPAMLWRGPFIDAARHWTDRGAGYTPPANPHVDRLAPGVPFAFLDTFTAPWPEAHERDPQRVRASPYVFRGYTVDENQFPVFRYHFGDVAVTDRILPLPYQNQPLEQMASDTIVRTVTVSNVPSGPPLIHRAAVGPLVEERPGQFTLGDSLRIRFSNDTVRQFRPRLRDSDGQKELVLEIPAGSERAEIVSRITWIQ